MTTKINDHIKKAKNYFNKFMVNKEDQDIALKLAACYHIRNGEVKEDGSIGTIEITYNEMKDLMAYALSHFNKTAKSGCKDCWGKGKIIRTAPIPGVTNEGVKKADKGMTRAKTDCSCVRLREEE
jgi:hypothetical protein